MTQALIKIARDGKGIGEYSLTDLGLALRAKTVLPSDYYWRPGMKDWEMVQLIATEAEGAVTLTASSAPTPPTAGMETKETTATSPMSRLHLVIGVVALLCSLPFFLFMKWIGDDIPSQMEWARSMDKGKLGYDLVEATESSALRWVLTCCTYFTLSILVAWIVSKVTYFIVLGKRREADIKLNKIGDAVFVAAIVIGFCGYLYALWHP